MSGRSYPVEVRYSPLVVEDDEEDTSELSLPEGIVKAVRELDESSRGIRGDTLVFLPGEKQIREAATALEEAELHNTEGVAAVLTLVCARAGSGLRRIMASAA